MVRDVTPEKPAVWRKLTGQDHYFHALSLLTTAVKYLQMTLQVIGKNRLRLLYTWRVQDINLPQGGLYGRESRENKPTLAIVGC